MTALRRRFAQIRCQRWLDGRRADGSYGVLWLTPAAEEMKEADWNFPEGRFLAYVLGPMEQGQAPIFIVLNAAPEEIAFKLPQMPEYKNWQQVLNTTETVQTAAGLRLGRRDQGAAALGACLCGLGMNDRQFGPRLTEGRRAVSAVGAGGKTRRCAAGQASRDEARRGRLVHRRHRRREGRRALQIPHRRRDRRSGSGVGVSARRRLWPERGDRSRGLSVARHELARAAVAGSRHRRGPCRHLHRSKAAIAP